MHHAAVQRYGDFWVVFDFAANDSSITWSATSSVPWYIGGETRSPNGWGLLRQRDRRFAAPTFPADGLYFCGIEYPRQVGPLPNDGRIICRPEIPSSDQVSRTRIKICGHPPAMTYWPRLLQAPTRSGWFSIRPARAP